MTAQNLPPRVYTEREVEQRPHKRSDRAATVRCELCDEPAAHPDAVHPLCAYHEQKLDAVIAGARERRRRALAH